jgi:sugar-specific transcriptional regulator TrmB
MEASLALKKIGLKDNEIKVYLTLLEIGSTTVGPLAKKVEMYRTYIYDILKKLIEMGLVHYVIEANKKYFEATEPAKLLELVKEKEEKLKEEKEIINTIIPQLAKLEKPKEEHKASVYRGKRGLKTILEDQLKQKKEILVLGAQGKFKKTFEHYWEQWNRKREKFNIPIKVIYNASLKKEKLKQKEILQAKLATIKFLTKNFDFPSTINIWHNKVATILWMEQPFAFVIESKEVVKSYRNFFELLWKLAEF